jgi:hypothetical protein
MKWIFAILFFSLSAVAQLSVSPSYVDFGDVRIDGGGFRYTSVWVRNSSNEQVSVYVGNSCFSPFYSSNSCYTLQPYGSCTVNIEFTPRSEGYHSCSININGGRGGFATIHVRGRGVASEDLEINGPFAE